MKGIITLTFLLFNLCINAQTVINFTHNQADKLEVNPFNDQAILLDDTIMVNASPAVAGGTQPYQFSWEPETGLNDPTSANPLASPTETTTYTFSVNDDKGCTTSNTFTIIVEMPQGLNITEVKTGKIYPNPAKNNCIIEWHENELPTIQIFDMNGKLVLTPLWNQKEKEINVDIQALSKGNYLVKAFSENVLVNYRLIVN